MRTPTVLPATAVTQLARTPGPQRRTALPPAAAYLSLPAMLLAGAAAAGLVPAGPAFVVVIALLAARAAQLGAGRGFVALAGCQLLTVWLVWRVGEAVAPSGAGPATLVPLLLAVPLAEIWIAGHLRRHTDALTRFDDRDAYLRHLRRSAAATLAAALPPLVAAAALAGTAHRLPYRLSEHPDAPALLLAMAGGVLLAGVVATSWLLAARARPWPAAAVISGAALGTLALHTSVPGLAATSLSGWGQPLPALVVALAIAYVAGLALTAMVLLDSRSYR